MNRRQRHVIVYYYEEENLELGGEFEGRAGPGMVLWRINEQPTGDDQEVNYVKQLDLSGVLGGSVDFAGEWKEKVKRTPPAGKALPAKAKTMFSNKYHIVIGDDGMLIMPQDFPGYVLDAADSRDLMTDLVLTDGDRYVFMDINATTGAVKRTGIIDQQDTDMTN
jgi:hypothetical protein